MSLSLSSASLFEPEHKLSNKIVSSTANLAWSRIIMKNNLEDFIDGEIWEKGGYRVSSLGRILQEGLA